MDEGFRLETDRLLLRPYRLEDLDDLHAMFSDPEHMRWYPEPFPREGSLDWLERQMARYRTRVPKGVFIYRSHDEANRDRDRWIVDAMVEARRVG